ncbi:hypothetical protein J4Q44_G00200190 [Coregonus suidteri]|uniref:Uncharacterized protein n=1 Tax=Coregonus suidteri TaxID=861788 RepID=A0AAN8LD71_9TELE
MAAVLAVLWEDRDVIFDITAQLEDMCLDLRSTQWISFKMQLKRSTHCAKCTLPTPSLEWTMRWRKRKAYIILYHTLNITIKTVQCIIALPCFKKTMN